MTALPEYADFRVTVILADDGKVTCQPNELAIPSHTIATITWVPAADNFKFKGFRWCHDHKFLSQDSIVHDRCVISSVRNTAGEGNPLGQHRYRLTVKSNHDGKERSTPQCPGPKDEGNGQPKIHNQ